MARSVYLIEIVAATDSAGTTTTLYFSTEGFVTSSSDTPANKYFEPYVKQPALMNREISATGQSNVGYGEIVLTNIDGALDYLIDYGFDGRSVTIRHGSGAYPSNFTTVLVGTMEQPEFRWNEVSIKIRDRQDELASKQLQTTKYAGTNSLPNGLEGVAGDIKGRPKPILYGQVFNITPVFVNTSRLIFQVNDGAVNSVDAVYDRGVSLTKGADYTDQTDMETNAPSAGYFRAWPSGGYFRLGSSLAGVITADVTQGAAASNRTVAQIMKSIAIDLGGVSSGDVDSGDVTALDTANSSVVGVYVDSETDISSVLDELSSSVGAWWGFDSLGKFRMARLAIPSGTAVESFTESEIIDIDRSGEIPSYSIKLKYKKFYTVQDSDLAGSVTNVRRSELKNEFREVISTDSAVLTKHLLASEREFVTLLVDATAAQTEADRLLDIYGLRQDYFEIRSRDVTIQYDIELGDVVDITVSRFGLSSGELFRVVGIESDLKRNEYKLRLWRAV